ncbi:odorant receptor 67c-like [Bicyclus anynana]|uniref:Odorant receptor n=1 Tax=Bicyclus anynana TaxID=110368 RepID=A0A6J1N1R2_BICAN|nr:odorant receptor 67c-like [Bicyclus anynana]
MVMQSLKNIFMKSYFDYDSAFDLFKFHPQLRVFLVLNGIFFNNPESPLRLIWPILSAALSLVATSFEAIFIYHGVAVKDYSFATECFCYFIIMTAVPVVYTSMILNREKIVDLLNSMNRDFLHICSLGSKYRSTFLKGQLLIWQLCIAWFTFVTTVVFTFLATTIAILMYQSLFATQTENIVRPLMFPLWLPKDDPYRTPNYEIFMFWEIVLMLIVVQTFCAYVYLLFHILLHYYYLMSMIIFDCEVLFVGLDASVVKLPKHDPRRMGVQTILNSRMRRIVKWHNLVFQSIEAVSSIFGPPLVYQVMFSSLPISLMAYQVAESLDHGRLDVMFAMLGIATCVQLWIPCYLGTVIRNKAFSVGDAIWSSGWHETPLGRLLRADITLVIMRSQRPVSIRLRGLPNLELETFSSIMSTSYTYFTLLRQYTGKMK